MKRQTLDELIAAAERSAMREGAPDTRLLISSIRDRVREEFCAALAILQDVPNSMQRQAD